MIQDYIQIACEEFGTTKDFFCKNRCQKNVLCRFILYKLFREELKMSLQEIADIFSMNHASISHGLEVVNNELRYNKILKSRFENIKRKINKKPMDERSIKIISHYGAAHQVDKLKEECGELAVAILEYSSYLKEKESYNVAKIEALQNNLIEEFADINVVLLQFKNFFDIDINKVQDVMNYKLDRTIKRMES